MINLLNINKNTKRISKMSLKKFNYYSFKSLTIFGLKNLSKLIIQESSQAIFS